MINEQERIVEEKAGTEGRISVEGKGHQCLKTSNVKFAIQYYSG